MPSRCAIPGRPITAEGPLCTPASLRQLSLSPETCNALAGPAALRSPRAEGERGGASPDGGGDVRMAAAPPRSACSTPVPEARLGGQGLGLGCGLGLHPALDLGDKLPPSPSDPQLNLDLRKTALLRSLLLRTEARPPLHTLSCQCNAWYVGTIAQGTLRRPLGVHKLAC